MPDLTQPHMCFTKDHDRRAAIYAFADRYGSIPSYVFEHSGMLWVGPIPQEQASPEFETAEEMEL